MRLPANVAAPMQKLTVPRMLSLSAVFESIRGVSAALFADAMRFIPERKKISLSISGLALSHESPDLTDDMSDTLSSVLHLGSGIRMNSSSTRNAAEKVMRSTAMTACTPPDVNSMVATSRRLARCEGWRRYP